MVKAAETNLAGVLEGKKQYQVPLYQRVYSWGKPQLNQLWNDIVELAATRRADPSATHFIGSLVLSQSPDFSVVGVSKLLVVDGQQRLTTLTILLAALRDHLIESGEVERAQGIQAQYLVNVYDKDKPAKVLPTQADRAAYLAVVRSAPDAGGSDNVGEAYNHFRSRIAAAHDPDDDRELEGIENAIVNGLALVVVTAEPRDNAHRIFESLNNTGLQLTQSDLLKNYLFMRLGDHGDEVYESVWLPLEKKLSAENLELLFWLDLVQTDERVKQSETYSGQQRRLERLAGPEEIATEVIRVAKLGDVLAAILDPSLEADAEIRRRLTRIRAWGSTTVYPVVMRLLDRRASGTATAEQVQRALTYLESYFVRRIVIGRATANLNRTLLQAVAAIGDADDIDAALRVYLSRGRKYYATDKQVQDAVRNVPFYWQGRAAQKKLILQWLEESFGSKEAVDPTRLTIEHVLPQTLAGAARDAFRGDLPEDADVNYEHDRLVHTIGNLTLTGYNSELSNRPFGEKRIMLAESALRMNQAIAAHTVWGPAQIDDRSSKLAQRIIDLWPGPDEAVVGTSDDEPSLKRLIASIVAEIPAGRWSSYGEVALVAGSYPQPVAAIVSSNPMQAGWRVMQAGGTISPGFKWLEPDRTEDPREFLESEGLTFDHDGHADAAQFVGAEELAELSGLEIDPTRRQDSGSRPLLEQRRAFFQRLHDLGESLPTAIALWPSASTKYAVDVNIGIAGTVASLQVSSREPVAVFCVLYIRDDKALFSHFHRHQVDIEASIGADLEWRNSPTNKSSQVVLRHDGDWRDETLAPDLARWLVTMTDRFAKVFAEYLPTGSR